MVGTVFDAQVLSYYDVVLLEKYFIKQLCKSLNLFYMQRQRQAPALKVVSIFKIFSAQSWVPVTQQIDKISKF